MQDTEANREWLRRQFFGASDRFLQLLAPETEPPFAILIQLLLVHIEDQKVTIRYIRRGKSGAGVLLLIPDDGIAKVVKYGRAGTICPEHESFSKTIKGNLPPDFATYSYDERPYTIGDEWASFCYWWAGGNDDAEQLRHVVARTTLAPEDLIRPLAELMENLFEWYGYPLRRTGKSPADLWKWRSGSRERIEEVLKQATHPEASTLLAFLDGDSPWRSNIGNKKFSRASKCHGDITCHNIVLSGLPSNLRVRVIDFGSIQEEQCPAYDWAKLERDLKFKCLGDLCSDRPEAFAKVLATVDQWLANFQPDSMPPLPATIDRQAVENIVYLIYSIRYAYTQCVGRASQAPSTEYLWFLLYWSLGFLDPRSYNHDPITVNAVINSVASLHDALATSVQTSQRIPVPELVIIQVAEVRRRHDESLTTLKKFTHFWRSIGPIKKLAFLACIFLIAAAAISVIPARLFSGSPRTYSIFVKLSGPDGIPIQDAILNCSVPCYLKRADELWEADISSNVLPPSRNISIDATTSAPSLRGNLSLTLNQSITAITLNLTRPNFLMHGILKDENSLPVPNIRIGLATSPSESVLTSERGEFELAAHAAEGEEVILALFNTNRKLTTKFYIASREMNVQIQKSNLSRFIQGAVRSDSQ